MTVFLHIILPIFVDTFVHLNIVAILANVVRVYRLWRYVGIPGAVSVTPLPLGSWAV